MQVKQTKASKSKEKLSKQAKANKCKQKHAKANKRKQIQRSCSFSKEHCSASKEMDPLVKELFI